MWTHWNRLKRLTNENETKIKEKKKLPWKFIAVNRKIRALPKEANKRKIMLSFYFPILQPESSKQRYNSAISLQFFLNGSFQVCNREHSKFFKNQLNSYFRDQSRHVGGSSSTREPFWLISEFWFHLHMRTFPIVQFHRFGFTNPRVISHERTTLCTTFKWAVLDFATEGAKRKEIEKRKMISFARRYSLSRKLSTIDKKTYK